MLLPQVLQIFDDFLRAQFGGPFQPRLFCEVPEGWIRLPGSHRQRFQCFQSAHLVDGGNVLCPGCRILIA
jgi:hypothetical protein